MTARLCPSYRFGIAREDIRKYRRPGIQPKWKTWVPRRELISRISRWYGRRTSSRVLVQRSRMRSNTGVSPAAGHDRWQSFLFEPERLVQSVVQFVDEAVQPANDGVIDGVQGTPHGLDLSWSTTRSHQMFDDKDVLVFLDRQMAVDQTKRGVVRNVCIPKTHNSVVVGSRHRLDLRIFHTWSGTPRKKQSIDQVRGFASAAGSASKENRPRSADRINSKSQVRLSRWPLRRAPPAFRSVDLRRRVPALLSSRSPKGRQSIAFRSHAHRRCRTGGPRP